MVQRHRAVSPEQQCIMLSCPCLRSDLSPLHVMYFCFLYAERGGQRYHHMLDGDGYVCRFSFAGGNNVHFLSRYVQTR